MSEEPKEISEIEMRMLRMEKDLADHIAWHEKRNSIVRDARDLLRRMDQQIQILTGEHGKLRGHVVDLLERLTPTDGTAPREEVDDGVMPTQEDDL